MKNKRIIISLIISLAIVLFSNNIYAAEDGTNGGEQILGTEEWTDLSEIKFELYDRSTSGFKEPALKISNIPTDKLKSDSYYYVVMSNTPNAEIKYNSETSNIEDYIFELSKKKSEEEITSGQISKYLEKNGDIYVSIVEQKFSTKSYKRIIEDQKVERISLYPLGKRVLCYFFSERTSTFLKEAYSGEEERKINLKIGNITDINILRAIKNRESGCLQKLMDYAKSAQSIYTGTIPVGVSDTITNNMNLVDKAYYYVYMEMEDENGKYYPVEDISLYQGCVGENIGKNLFDYLDSNFEWNLDEEKVIPPDSEGKQDPTLSGTILPKTGIATVIGAFVTILAVNTIIGMYKYNRYKGIK